MISDFLKVKVDLYVWEGGVVIIGKIYILSEFQLLNYHFSEASLCKVHHRLPLLLDHHPQVWSLPYRLFSLNYVLYTHLYFLLILIIRFLFRIIIFGRCIARNLFQLYWLLTLIIVIRWVLFSAFGKLSM